VVEPDITIQISNEDTPTQNEQHMVGPFLPWDTLISQSVSSQRNPMHPLTPPYLHFSLDNKDEIHAKDLSSSISLRNDIGEIGASYFETLWVTPMVMSGSHYSDSSQTLPEEEEEAIKTLREVVLTLWFPNHLQQWKVGS
jgi:hypothetical protein